MADRTDQGTGKSVAVSSNIWGLVGAVAFMLVVYVLPTPAPMERNGEVIGLTVNGKACLAVLAFAVTLWVTEALPFAVTSLFVVLLIPAFGIADYATVVAAGFGNPIITFFIGVLILSSGFAPLWSRDTPGSKCAPSVRHANGPSITGLLSSGSNVVDVDY